MIRQHSAPALTDLYETDETAWLEAMAELIELERLGDLDYAHLAEYLADMARRDRREVESRLKTLMAHLLKWTYQSEQRSNSWRATIILQRQELAGAVGRGVLRNQAQTVLADVYTDAVELAAAETGLALKTFPNQCPFSLEQLLSPDVLEEEPGENSSNKS